jgi:hypothetical protein
MHYSRSVRKTPHYSLALEDEGGDNCLTWWRTYKHTLNNSWFDNIFPRLPRGAMNHKNHDENWYQMENQDWMRKAAIYILRINFNLSGLIATHGTPEEQKMMQDEIAWDQVDHEVIHEKTLYQGYDTWRTRQCTVLVTSRATRK